MVAVNICSDFGGTAGRVDKFMSRYGNRRK